MEYIVYFMYGINKYVGITDYIYWGFWRLSWGNQHTLISGQPHIYLF